MLRYFPSLLCNQKMEPKELSIELLKKITNGFSEKIGEGSFGVVYKGKLNGQQVAVKKLRDSSAVNEREFEREVQILRLVEQQNIVKLIGYCCQKQDKLEPSRSFGARDVVDKFLCFEYVSNGSLNNHIYGEPSKLGWDKRLKIIEDNFTWLGQTLEDFGLSRLFGENQTHTRITNSKSAIEYMAPEYLQRGQLSIESDIYSLGLLIIEITTGEKNCSDHELYDTDFTEDVRKCWTTMPYIKSKYPALSAAGHRQVKKSVEIGLSCLKKKRKERPTSGDIVKKIDQIGAGSSSVFGKIIQIAVNVKTRRGSHFLRNVLWANVLLQLMCA